MKIYIYGNPGIYGRKIYYVNLDKAKAELKRQRNEILMRGITEAKVDTDMEFTFFIEGWDAYTATWRIMEVEAIE